ncbi:NUDIX hydrolase [Jannaschia marina]|uniref:NUDIX hydrolase n=1 Tax=Jannaschia marina TaxID=2741674 RepID=UPI0015CB7E3E|nr:NUDIX domain-containing protein [Jannaschia marina]
MPEIPIRAFIVSCVVLRPGPRGHEVLLMRRMQTLAGAWCQIAGKIEPGETAWAAALREMREETGLVPNTFYSGDCLEQFYEADRDAITVAPVFVALVGREAEVTLNDEHDAFEWLSFESARDRVDFGGQRRILTEIEESFDRRRPPDWLRIGI